MPSSLRFQTPALPFLFDNSHRDDTPPLAPVYGPLTLEDSIHKLDEELKALRGLVENTPAKRVVTPIAGKVEDRPFDPFGPADNDNALRLQHAFRHMGVLGLARTAQHIATEYQKDSDIQPSKNYDMLSAKQNQSDFVNVLLTMHSKFTEHLLRGDLMWEYFHDEDFYNAVNVHHSLSKYPGTYIQAVVRADSELRAPDTNMSAMTLLDYRQKNPDAGSWLTGREIVKVYDAAVKYLPSNIPNQPNLAKEIDQMYPGWDVKGLSWYQRGNRRYVNKSNEPKFKRWLATWYSTYVKRILVLMGEEQTSGKTNPILDVPLRSCPFEIGYGANVMSRANSHDAHKQSNALWTFFLALLHHQVDKNATQFVVYRFQTNRLSDPDNAAHDARLSDVGMTLIARSEWHQGGFNPVPGGGAGVNESALDKALPWLNENFQTMYSENSVFALNVKKNKVIMENLKREKYELDHQHETVANLEQERKDQEARIKDLQDTVEGMKEVLRLKQVLEMEDSWREARGLGEQNLGRMLFGRESSAEFATDAPLEAESVAETPPVDTVLISQTQTEDVAHGSTVLEGPESEEMYD